LLVSQPGDAGVAHVVADYVGWLVSAGWRVTVACRPDSRLAYLVGDRGGGVCAWSAGREPGPKLASECRRLQRIIAETDPELVHLHSSKAGLVGRLTVRGRRPTVFQPHAWSFQAATSTQAVLARRWECYATHWTDLTICVSHAERQQGIRAGVRGPTTVLPNTVDLDRFHPPPDRVHARDQLLSSLGLPPGGPLALCVGRLSRQKGQDLLLAAWPRVLAAVPDAMLLLVGDGPDRVTLSRSAPSRVLLVGAVEDAWRWLRAADVVAVPSRWEGQALTVLEAMACATPVVASNIAANAEALPPAAGALVDAHDANQLATALRERLTRTGRVDGAREGAAGRHHVITHHRPDQAAAQLAQLYDRVTHHAPGRGR